MTKLIPRSVLFGNPERSAAQISPDGSRLSFLAPRDGVLNVWVQDLPDGEARPLTTADKRPIRSYGWARDGKHLLYVQDKDGNENFHVYAVDAETSDERDLTPI